MIHERIELGTEASARRGEGPASRPCLTTYVLDGERTRGAVLVCPGGAYRYTSPREAEPIALRFNAAGFHAFVLDYSVAPARYPAALEDGSRAMCLIRRRAAEWRITPGRVAACGFSAGGHAAASLAFLWDSPRLRSSPGVEIGPNRPDALVLAYPVISSGEFAHRGSFDNLLGPGAGAELLEEVSLERRVGPDAPPTFIWHTSDDAAVPVENSLLLASALRARGLAFELHVYRSGTHGLSLATDETEEPDKERRSDPRVATWMDLCSSWLKDLWS